MHFIRVTSPITVKLSPFEFAVFPPATPSYSRISSHLCLVSHHPACIHLQRLWPRDREVRVGGRMWASDVGSQVGDTSLPKPQKLWAIQTLSPHDCCCGIELWWQRQLWLHWRKQNSWRGLVGVLLICAQIALLLFTMGSGLQWREPDKKVPFYWKCGFLLPIEVNVKICSCEGQRVEPNSFKKATRTHEKAVFKADHTFLMNPECLLPSLGWSVYRIKLRTRFLKNAGISKNMIPLFPIINLRILCIWEITLGSTWSQMMPF